MGAGLKTERIEGVRIEAVYASVPLSSVSNSPELAQTTGIRSRRIAGAGVSPLDLCLAAAERMFAATGFARDDFGAVVFVSFTEPERMPSAACQAQARLGLPSEVLAFDVSMACSGYGYGLYLASLLARQSGKKTLLLDGDVQSAWMKSGDASTSAVLADGGTATVIAPGDSSAPSVFAFATHGGKGDALRLGRGSTIAMDGFGVFRFVATEVVAFLKEFLSATGLPPDSLAAFVPHQANVYMISQLAKSLGIPVEKLAVSCDEIGNLSSASVPATLAMKRVDGRILVSGFGGGLSIAAALLEIPADCSFGFFDYDGRS